MRRLSVLSVLGLVALAALYASLQPPASSLALDVRNPPGLLFVGHLESGDHSAPANEAAARIPLYEAGTTSTITLGPNDQVVITDAACVYLGFAITEQTIFYGADATPSSGEIILRTQPGSLTPTTVTGTLAVGPPGEYPKFLTGSTTSSTVTIHGYVIRK